MKITCNHCQRSLSMPDEKVPKKPFALKCPECQGRIEVDPTAREEPSVEGGGEAGGGEAGGAVSFEPLPPVRELDKELLEGLYPLAAVVNLSAASVEPYEAALRLLGMEEIRCYDDLATATESMLDSDYSIVLIVMDRATAPPCEPLAPLYALPLAVRRRSFVALAADNVRSLDGQTAFYLQVHCLLSTKELAKLPVYMQRALLFHLRRYRFWGVREE